MRVDRPYLRPLHGTGGAPGLFHLRIFLIFSIFMDKKSYSYAD